MSVKKKKKKLKGVQLCQYRKSGFESSATDEWTHRMQTKSCACAQREGWWWRWQRCSANRRKWEHQRDVYNITVMFSTFSQGMTPYHISHCRMHWLTEASRLQWHSHAQVRIRKTNLRHELLDCHSVNEGRGATVLYCIFLLRFLAAVITVCRHSPAAASY